MKIFRCGDVVPDCPAAFTGAEGEILERVAQHARLDHGLAELTPELVGAVRTNMRTV